jgi:tetratricopeptide (TPR) repeat protein
MKKTGLLLFATIVLAGCASTPGPMVEADYPTGSLGLAAIERGDWSMAERLLTADRRVSKNDPARLINLGRVYMATGRSGEALAAWQQALAAPNPVEVETLDGRMAMTDEIAREALDRYQSAVVTAAR